MVFPEVMRVGAAPGSQADVSVSAVCGKRSFTADVRRKSCRAIVLRRVDIYFCIFAPHGRDAFPPVRIRLYV